MAFQPLYRSAKIGAALMVIVVFAALYRFIVAAEAGMKMREAVARLAGIWVGCLMMPMFDREGVLASRGRLRRAAWPGGLLRRVDRR